jgi:hypothetical protein
MRIGAIIKIKYKDMGTCTINVMMHSNVGLQTALMTSKIKTQENVAILSKN